MMIQGLLPRPSRVAVRILEVWVSSQRAVGSIIIGRGWELQPSPP